MIILQKCVVKAVKNRKLVNKKMCMDEKFCLMNGSINNNKIQHI